MIWRHGGTLVGFVVVSLFPQPLLVSFGCKHMPLQLYPQSRKWKMEKKFAVDSVISFRQVFGLELIVELDFVLFCGVTLWWGDEVRQAWGCCLNLKAVAANICWIQTMTNTDDRDVIMAMMMFHAKNVRQIVWGIGWDTSFSNCKATSTPP